VLQAFHRFQPGKTAPIGRGPVIEITTMMRGAAAHVEIT
jgi:hypothetical protein